MHRFAILTLAAVSPLIAPAWAEKPEPKPYKGKMQVIPGVVEAEHFDEGPAGVAYFDVDDVNHGADYREPTGVDIEARPDASNKHGIGWIRETEWLIYTVEVKEAGEYVLEIPVASNKPGGTFHIQFDGVDVTGPITIPDTGGWDKLETLKVEGVTLKAGVQRMKLMMDKDGESGGIGDIDLVRFKKAEPAE
ncbi:MAG: carbohydrate-binding protein [Candidatus Hydrogenedentes bacterium]|nr:carbohydrate-binding protein [Candidatus Hydrogenedentota bacterium]